MDRILKVVYDNWYETVPLSNGIHPVLFNYLKQSISNSSNVDSSVRNLMNSEMFPFRYHDNLFKYFKDYTKICPEEITDNNDIYIYPVEIKTNINTLYKKHTFTLNGARYDYQLDSTFSPKILSYLQTGKVKLVINYIHDPISHPDEMIGFDRFIKSIGIDGNNVKVVSGNKFTVPNSDILVTSGPLLYPREDSERITSSPQPGRLGYINDYVKEHDLDYSKIRPYKFLCFNRQLTGRAHRIALAYLALKYDLLTTSIFSFLEKIDERQTFMSAYPWKHYYQNVDMKEVSGQISKMLPLEIDTQRLEQSEKTNFSTHNNKKELYLNTYIHIVSETRFHYGESPFISEKTYRPIANLQPFLYVGNYNSLKNLHDMGFKTFHPCINEAYDLEKDPETRMLMIEQELKKLNDLTIEQLHELYYNVKDILVYNRNHLATFTNAQPYQNLIRELQNGI